MKKGIFMVRSVMVIGFAMLAQTITVSGQDCCAISSCHNREAIDLGLSVNWAIVNIGAESPADYGDYFAWGETVTKPGYTLDNCRWYNMTLPELRDQGVIDGNDRLTAKYDAAAANWSNGWRMPTIDEIQELLDNCDWAWTDYDGTEGYRVTGPSGNSIFLPAAGSRCDDSLRDAGTDGSYWSSTPYYRVETSACVLNFDSSLRLRYNFGYLFYGRSVRPVQTQKECKPQDTSMKDDGSVEQAQRAMLMELLSMDGGENEEMLRQCCTRNALRQLNEDYEYDDYDDNSIALWAINGRQYSESPMELDSMKKVAPDTYRVVFIVSSGAQKGDTSLMEYKLANENGRWKIDSYRQIYYR